MDNFFYTGGTVPPDNWDSYIEREADDVLYKSLSTGDFCYILTSRQMGKSSLAKRVSYKLEKDGLKCVYIELNIIGRNPTEEEWYFSISDKICEQSGVKFNLNEWWTQNKKYTSLERFAKFIDYLVKHIDQKIIVFIDEIDLVLSIGSLQTDDFFAAIRGLYQERANDSRFNNISFALIGVAAPNDLMKDTQRTPFNIGKAISLQNLDYNKAYPILSKGLPGNDDLKKIIIQQIFKWTGGQPYLTQVLCMRISEDINIHESEYEYQIENIITNAIKNEPKITDHIGYVAKRLLGMPEYTLQMLGCYQKIYNGEEVKIIANDATQIYLRLTGLVMQDKDHLIISNKIYKTYFTDIWINASFYKNNKYYSFLKQWLDSGKTIMPTGINEKVLIEYRQWADINAANIENFQFINYCADLLYKKEKRRRRIIEISGFIFLVGLISIIGYALNAAIKNRDIKLYEANLSLKKYQITKQDQERLADLYFNKLMQLRYSTTDKKLVKELKSIEDSLKTVFNQTDIIFKLIEFNTYNTEQISKQSIKLDSLQKLVIDCLNGNNKSQQQRSGNITDIYTPRKLALIAICDRDMDNLQYKSGNFYSQLAIDLQNKLANKFSIVSASDINGYISQQNINLCSQRFRSLEIARRFNSDLCVIVEFSTNSVKLKFKDIPGNKDYYADKSISVADFDNYSELKTTIIRQLTQILK